MPEATQYDAGRLIAIGDIHGHAKALRGILSQIRPKKLDTIVTLGDCVNRGPESRLVLDHLMDLRRICHVVSILGNHDDVMLDSRNDPNAFNRWMHMGGKETIHSYSSPLVPEEIRYVQDKHWELLAGFVPFYETDNFIFTHANYCWYRPMDQQEGRDLRWLSLDESQPKPHVSGKTVIMGHTPGPVRDVGHYRCIDTGCGFGGLLTAMEVHSGHCWQVRESGELVAGTGV